ncbi:MAG TPA: 2,3-bisphosphoglycerate-independent phosphoglycerate mutase [Candidatus Wolfebacteria bacterium]|nr:2,3-bisphosphoglycerate-independent phosphoglycerate mutase [Candidatus Wolfebacteria bacterium]
MSKRTVVLAILDGWGIGRMDESNPIFTAKPPNIDYIKRNFPSGALQASGIAVGLPWGEEGNSEVGHLNLGSGKIVYQNYPKITLAIRDGSFFKNTAIKNAFEHVKKNNSRINFIGLLSKGNIHSSFEHLEALMKFAKQEGLSEMINLHLITDGRDSPPQSAIEMLTSLPKDKLASIAGRYYAMDRDKHWDRTQKAYQLLTGDGATTDDFETHIKNTYKKNLNDEYVEPVLINKSNSRYIKDGDAIIFFNFREDRMRQIVEPFIDDKFDKFPIKKFSNLYVSTMISYEDKFNVNVIFQKEKIENPLGKILADNQKSQFRVAETEKYAHITYFFNGQKEKPFKNEYRILIPSQNVIRHDEHPEMMAAEITSRVIGAIEDKGFDFILVNYANPDMVAHTGNYQASIQAVKITDEEIGKLKEVVLRHNAILIITSDHGNIERMFNPLTGAPETKHDPSPVPIYLIAKEYEKKKSEAKVKKSESEMIGVLADVAPTVLELMDIPKPKEMTGKSLLKELVM